MTISYQNIINLGVPDFNKCLVKFSTSQFFEAVMTVMYIHGCDFASNNLSAWCERKVMAEVVKATIPTSKRKTMRGKSPGATALTKVATLKCMPF